MFGLLLFDVCFQKLEEKKLNLCYSLIAKNEVKKLQQ
jgi:hypothetical protein